MPVDFRGVNQTFHFPHDSDADFIIRVADTNGAAVSLAGRTLSLDLLRNNAVVLSAAMDHADAASGAVSGHFDYEDFATQFATPGHMRARIRSVTDNKTWVTGRAEVTNEGRRSVSPQIVPITDGAVVMELTVSPLSVGGYGGGGGVTDHGGLDGLTDSDDHTQYQLRSEKDQADGYAGLDGSGKVATSVLPALAIGETFTAADETAMLALSAQQGDIAVRSDTLTTWILSGSDPAMLGDWTQLATPTDQVLSVNGQTGVVVLVPGDIGAADAAQGALADSAVQPGDGIDQLNAVAFAGFLSAVSGVGMDAVMEWIDDNLDSAALAAAADFDAAGAAAAAQSAAQSYAEGLFATNDALVYRGAIDCSTDPDYPAADAGHTWRVSVAGKIGGASGPNVEVGDRLTCNADGTASGDHATVGANWDRIQVDIDGAITGPASSTDTEILRADGTSGKVAQGSGVALDASALTGTRTLTMPDEDVDLGDVGSGGGGLWQQHSETTLGSTASSVALSFPATYQAIRIVVQAQSTHTSTVGVYGTVNADSGSNYDQVSPPVNTSFAVWANSTVLKFGSVGSNGASEVISELEIWHEVRQSGKYAYFQHRNFREWEYVDRQSLFIGWNRWRDTSTAISTLTLFLQSSKEFEAGSYFRVEYIA